MTSRNCSEASLGERSLLVSFAGLNNTMSKIEKSYLLFCICIVFVSKLTHINWIQWEFRNLYAICTKPTLLSLCLIYSQSKDIFMLVTEPSITIIIRGQERGHSRDDITVCETSSGQNVGRYPRSAGLVTFTFQTQLSKSPHKSQLLNICVRLSIKIILSRSLLLCDIKRYFLVLRIYCAITRYGFKCGNE